MVWLVWLDIGQLLVRLDPSDGYSWRGPVVDALTAYQYLRGRRATPRERFRTSKDDDSAQVTVYETIIELENITSKQNISVLVNETVLFNTTINVTYDVLRNVTYDVTFNQTYNVTFNTTVNATDSA